LKEDKQMYVYLCAGNSNASVTSTSVQLPSSTMMNNNQVSKQDHQQSVE